MKLELKHLAPYLPYALGFLHQGKFYQLLQLNIPYDQKPLWIEGWDGEELISVFPEGCEPVLRPMSDLTKEIEHNGEKFTPSKIIERHNKSLMLGFGRFDFKRWTWDLLIKHFHYRVLPHWIVEQLIEWHFDIFGLIPKGLAVDINTLKL